MFKNCNVFAIIFVLFVITPFTLAAQVTFSPSVDLWNEYSWRGFHLADAPVVQPGLDIGIEGTGLSFNIWGSWAVSDRDKYAAADEIDFTASYSRSIGKASLTAGFIHYQFLDLDSDNNTQEVFLSYAPGLELLNPSVTLYYDLNLAEDFYIELSTESHAGPVHIESALGYNNGQYINEAGLSRFLLGASYPIELGWISISPATHFEYIFYDDVEEETRFVFGLSISK